MPVFVAMDCEMVDSKNKKNILARVSIVDRQGSILLDEYVKPTADITDYKTKFSGIKKGDLDNGKPFDHVKNRVSNLISGKILVGHSLRVDLEALGLSHPESDQRDLTNYGTYKRKNGQPYSLQDLAKNYLKKNIQVGEHDSKEDARAAMELYNLVASNWN